MFSKSNEKADETIVANISRVYDKIKSVTATLTKIISEPEKYPGAIKEPIKQIQEVFQSLLADLDTIKTEYNTSIKLILREIRAAFLKNTFWTIIITIALTIAVTYHRQIYEYLQQGYYYFTGTKVSLETDKRFLEEMIRYSESGDIQKAFEKSLNISPEILSSRDQEAFQIFKHKIEWLLLKNNPRRTEEELNRFEEKNRLLMQNMKDSKLIFFIFIDILITKSSNLKLVKYELENAKYAWEYDRAFNLIDYLFRKSETEMAKKMAADFKEKLLKKTGITILSMTNFAEMKHEEAVKRIDNILGFKEEAVQDAKSTGNADLKYRQRIGIYTSVSSSHRYSNYLWLPVERDMRKIGYNNVTFIDNVRLPSNNFLYSQIIFSKDECRGVIGDVKDIDCLRGTLVQVKELDDVKSVNAPILRRLLLEQFDLIIVIGNNFK